ncbi:9941_t:CDS:2 [Acaulospora morrowiae]|uniref:9941_t:CDS:1 n=1 Tax=Acaulospora morrowiae TaxID=94023 RepID=A0A9N9CSN3_9GLOM|nr:9941_t:CDS:2 [Acaulospora morrowiae]
MDQLKLKIDERLTITIVSIISIRTRALGNINNLKISIQEILIPTPVQVVDSKDEILILGNDWFEKVKARIYIDEQKLILKYKDQKIKVPITNDRARKMLANETDDNEQYDEKQTNNDSDSNDDTQSESCSNLGFNNKTRSKGSSFAMYFTQVRESLPSEEEKTSEEVSIEKGNKTSIIIEKIQAEVLEELSHIRDKQIIKSTINFDTGTLEKDPVAQIEELPIPMEII